MGARTAGGADRESRLHDPHDFPVHIATVCALISSGLDAVPACNGRLDQHVRAAVWLRVPKQHHARAGQLCRTADDGRCFATCCTVVGVVTLVGMLIAGEILKRQGGSYVSFISITFGGTSYAVALVLFSWTRIRVVDWGLA